MVAFVGLEVCRDVSCFMQYHCENDLLYSSRRMSLPILIQWCSRREEDLSALSWFRSRIETLYSKSLVASPMNATTWGRVKLP